MSDPIVHVALREVELDYVLNGAPDEYRDPNELLTELLRWAETVIDLIDRSVVE